MAGEKADDTAIPGEITIALLRLRDGGSDALAELIPLVYNELRVIAATRMRNERDGHSIAPTELVHEAWMRLFGNGSTGWVDRHHFFRAASIVMRHILVDYARRRRRKKRNPGEELLPMRADFVALQERAIDIVALDEAMKKLEAIAPRQSMIIELRFFAGLSNQEAAEVVGVSVRTAHIDWRLARAWLLREMSTS